MTTNTNSIVYYFNISDLNGANSQEYFINLTGSDITSQSRTIKIYNGYATVTPVVSDSAIQTILNDVYERQGNDYVNISPMTTYQINGEYYLHRTPGGGGTAPSNAEVGLYLNNPALPNSEYQPTGNGIERLFVICS
jgi:hypothetical protein